MQCKQCLNPIDRRTTHVTCHECQAPMHKECVVNHDGVFFCDVCFVVATEKPKSRFGDFELPKVIRRTHIETYRTCPYKFYLEVIKGHEMPPNCYTSVGADLHVLFEQAIKGNVASADDMKKAFEDMYWCGYSDELFVYKSREDMWERAMDSIDTFYTILPLIENVATTEQTIEYSIGDNIPMVQITMDLVTERDGELDIHDWKTGHVMVGKKLSTDLQAPLYIYAIKNHFNKPVRSFTFYYLHENKTRTFIRSEINPEEYICTVGKREYKINLTNAIREVKSLFSRIKKGDFNIPQDTKSMYFACKMCHLKEQGLCAGAEEESWNLITK